jgi:hypothetical protein
MNWRDVVPRLPKMLLTELAKAREWRVEAGGKHWKLIVNGKLAGVIQRGPRSDHQNSRATVNTRSQIRNILRESA